MVRNPGEETDYYTVGCLAYFLRNIQDDHPEYVRKCICDKVQCVRRVDRDNIKQYITGKKIYKGESKSDNYQTKQSTDAVAAVFIQ